MFWSSSLKFRERSEWVWFIDLLFYHCIISTEQLQMQSLCLLVFTSSPPKWANLNLKTLLKSERQCKLWTLLGSCNIFTIGYQWWLYADHVFVRFPIFMNDLLFQDMPTNYWSFQITNLGATSFSLTKSWCTWKNAINDFECKVFTDIKWFSAAIWWP